MVLKGSVKSTNPPLALHHTCPLSTFIQTRHGPLASNCCWKLPELPSLTGGAFGKANAAGDHATVPSATSSAIARFDVTILMQILPIGIVKFTAPPPA